MRMTNNSEPQKDFAQEFYWRMREAITGRLSRDAKRIAEKELKANSRPFEKGRDFVKGGDAIDSLMKAFRWEGQLAEADHSISGPRSLATPMPPAANRRP